MKRASAALLLILAGWLLMPALTTRVSAQYADKLMFPDREDAKAEIIRLIRLEDTRLDIAVWFLVDGEIVNEIIRKHQAGVPVRVIGDRVGIFEADPNTYTHFNWLAQAGVPIRVRYNPSWFPEIIHWKSAIFVGQRVVEFGSGNWTTDELKPFSSTNFKDETLLFTGDNAIFEAFLTKFDRYWVDDTEGTEHGQHTHHTEGYFKDWPEAYKLETGQNWAGPVPAISRQRLVSDFNTNVSGMVWSQGPELIAKMVEDINAETQAIDFVSYRLTVPQIADALIAKHQAGVPVRVLIEPLQYRNAGYPEYWLVGYQADRMWAAGIPIKIRTHAGLTHMKAIITSRSALVASSNFTKFWQRDHNYFIPALGKPELYLKYKDQFNKVWNDTANYGNFTPLRPNEPALIAPGSGTGAAALQPKLEWKRAPWAVFFDVHLGTNASAVPKVQTVNAVMTEEPPETYSFTPTQALLPNTTYYWYVISRTAAGLTLGSEMRSFTTGGSGGGNPNPTGPFGGTPVSLPGTIEAENFDNGANNVAYFDTTAGNSGSVYRATDVDIAASEDPSGGNMTVGWMAPSEWLAYTVNVATAGTYTLEFRVAALGAGGTFHVEANGTNVTGPLVIPNTGGWLTWTTVTKTGVTLGAGTQVMRLVIDSAGPGGVVGNVNFIRVVAGGGTTPPPTGNTPYGGTPTALPGLLQAENFDEGGANVGYFDTTAGNAGGQYRPEHSVDIEASFDAGGGYNLGWVKAGEWLKYTVNVAAAGTYTLEFRVAATSNGGTFHLEVNGVDKTGPMTVPATGGYQTWTTISKSGVTLSAGQQVWRLVIDSAGSVVGNFNYIRVVSAGGSPPSGPTPFTGTPVALPGRVEVENFDNGGPGVAYQDLDAVNAGGEYRQADGVDIAGSGDTGGGYLVGWAFAGEWLKYSVNVANAGTYDIEVRVASAGAGGTFHIEVNGVDKTGPMTVPNTNGWLTWATIRKSGVTLSAGPQQIRLVMDTNGPTTATGNFNWIRIALPGQ